ncbi:uncharacterized protein DS421_2g47600 [Arachis hypogaea]|nr:uncharacterized protein DS421_2g47600 [Arachis hypogaea]
MPLECWVWNASYWNQGKTIGVAHQPLGMARWYKFSEMMKEAKTHGRATWCRRRGTPSTIPHLGVPLEPQAWHASVI